MLQNRVNTTQEEFCLSSPERVEITGCAFATIYVDDFSTALKFYTDVLNLQDPQEMGPKACYFNMGSFGLYLIGGNTRHQSSIRTTRLSFALVAEHTSVLFQQLQSVGIEPFQEKPMDMGNGVFWFQFYDPSGNIIEIAGPE